MSDYCQGCKSHNILAQRRVLLKCPSVYVKMLSWTPEDVWNGGEERIEMAKHVVGSWLA